MPKGPQGQKRPADVIGNAVRVMEIATGQREGRIRGRRQGPSSEGVGREGRQGAGR